MMRAARSFHAIRAAIASSLLVLLVVAGIMIQEQNVQQRKATHAAGLVERLLDAETGQVPAIISELIEYRQWTDPLLSKEHQKAAAFSRRKLHTSLATLKSDPGQVDYLYSHLLTAESHEVPIICNALLPHMSQLQEKLWSVIETPRKSQDPRRLRAAAALAKFSPDSDKWNTFATAICNDLVSVPAVHLSLWMDSLRPIRTKLISPLVTVYRDKERGDFERSIATDILANYAAADPKILADLLLDSDEKQFVVIYPQFGAASAKDLAALTSEINRTPATDWTSDAKERLSQRQANAAVALYKLNQPEALWPLLKHSANPGLRSHLIHRLAKLGADADLLVKRLETEPDVTIRSALVLCLGEYSEDDLSPDARTALLPQLREIYINSTHPGLHASVEWLLRTWKEEGWLKQVNDGWAANKKQPNHIEQAASAANRRWYVNSQSQTLVVIPGPTEFLIGSPLTEAGRNDAERQHRMRINRTFAIATKPVTVDQFKLFEKRYEVAAVYTRMSDLPVVDIEWYKAVKYCNWLSEQEGIPSDQWCYETLGGDIKQKANALTLSGYRLPTEAEIEFATRAGSSAARYFGEGDDLLPKYAWFTKNAQERTWPVGRMKPNDFGLFDMQGNVYNWCHNSRKPYSDSDEIDDDSNDDDAKDGTVNRALRGGSFNTLPSNVRSAYRYSFVPSSRNVIVGFRLARTFPATSQSPPSSTIAK